MSKKAVVGGAGHQPAQQVGGEALSQRPATEDEEFPAPAPQGGQQEPADLGALGCPAHGWLPAC